MAHRDFREFIAVSEQQGKLKRIQKSVDRSWEPACLAKWMFQSLPAKERFGLLFDNVEGSAFKIATGVIGASEDTYALALGVEPDQITETWVAALLDPKPPATVDSGPCQEVVLRGEDARLGDLPIPTWTPGKDAAPYITTITVTRHAESGVQNMGVYRTQVKDDHNAIANLSPGRQGHRHYLSYVEAGKPAPIAWVIGTEPVIHLASVANMPIDVDEMSLAGGLKGAPVEMVKCVTSDLMVPANSEIIIEGELYPGEMDLEGPFGEFAGYMGPVSPKPVARITAITHRKDAIFYGLTSQMPPSESTVMQSLTNAPILLKTLQHDLGEKGVRDVFIDLTFGGLLAHCIVAMKPSTPGHAKRLGRLIADMTPLKRITVVDDDVDIRDPLHVEWCMNSHYNPVRDTVIIDDVYFPMHMDPSVRVDNDAAELGSKVVIDATRSIDAGVFSLPSRDIMMKALEVWKEVGLPEFDIPKRVNFRLDRS
jgi:2,5-furandicarboxylate decarboxylase 1